MSLLNSRLFGAKMGRLPMVRPSLRQAASGYILGATGRPAHGRWRTKNCSNRSKLCTMRTMASMVIHASTVISTPRAWLAARTGSPVCFACAPAGEANEALQDDGETDQGVCGGTESSEPGLCGRPTTLQQRPQPEVGHQKRRCWPEPARKV